MSEGTIIEVKFWGDGAEKVYNCAKGESVGVFMGKVFNHIRLEEAYQIEEEERDNREISEAIEKYGDSICTTAIVGSFYSIEMAVIGEIPYCLFEKIAYDFPEIHAKGSFSQKNGEFVRSFCIENHEFTWDPSYYSMDKSELKNLFDSEVFDFDSYDDYDDYDDDPDDDSDDTEKLFERIMWIKKAASGGDVSAQKELAEAYFRFTKHADFIWFECLAHGLGNYWYAKVAENNDDAEAVEILEYCRFVVGHVTDADWDVTLKKYASALRPEQYDPVLSFIVQKEDEDWEVSFAIWDYYLKKKEPVLDKKHPNLCLAAIRHFVLEKQWYQDAMKVVSMSHINPSKAFSGVTEFDHGYNWNEENEFEDNVLGFWKQLWKRYKNRIDLSEKIERYHISTCPILIAAEERWFDAVNWLIEECGADVSVVDSLGNGLLLRTMFFTGDDYVSFDGGGKEISLDLLRRFPFSSISRVSEYWQAFIFPVSVTCDDEELIDAVIRAGADINAEKDGLLPIHRASGAGNLVFVKLMVEKYGINPNLPAVGDDDLDTTGMSPLFFAATRNRLEVMKWLVEEAGVDVNSRDPFSNGTALHFVERKRAFGVDANLPSYRLNIEPIKWLVEKGVDVNASDNFGYTALHWAAKYDHIQAVKYFIEECHMDPGLDVGAGKPAVAAQGNSSIVRYLHRKEKEYDKANKNSICMESGSGAGVVGSLNRCLSNIRELALDGNYDSVMYFISRCNIDLSKLFAELPLFPIELCDYEAEVPRDVVFTLWKKLWDKYDIDLTVTADRDQFDASLTPLLIAAEEGWFDVIKWLIEKCGAEVSAVDSLGYGLLYKVLYGSEDEYDYRERDEDEINRIIKYLLKKYPYSSISGVSETCGSILHKMATYCESEEAIKCMMDAGADINSSNSEGLQPLHEAIKWGNLTFVRLAVEKYGVDPSIQIDDGITALHFAAMKDQKEIVKFFIEQCHMDPTLNCGAGTPAQVAEKNGNADIVRYLHKKEKESSAENGKKKT